MKFYHILETCLNYLASNTKSYLVHFQHWLHSLFSAFKNCLFRMKHVSLLSVLEKKLHLRYPQHKNDRKFQQFSQFSSRNWNQLIPFKPLIHFYTPWKRRKTSAFLTFSGVIEIEHWLKMGSWSSNILRKKSCGKERKEAQFLWHWECICTKFVKVANLRQLKSATYLRQSISLAYWGPCKTSMMERFCENN